MCVPLFKFGAPHLPGIGETLEALGELPPAFLFSFIAGVAFSLGDPSRHERAARFAEDVREGG